MAFVYTTAIRKLRKLNKRIKIIPGGTSAGKTYGILPILIDKAIKTPGLEISVVAESIPNLRRGALKDFTKIMQQTNRWIDDNYSRTLLTYKFANGSYIEFFGADQEAKVRGARRNILYINECNNVNFEIYQQLAIRTSDEVWLDFNPTHEFWAHTELNDDPDSDTLKLTYKDNEALGESIIKEIEKGREKAKKSAYWSNWWQVYGLGNLGSLEGVIFDNWKLIDTIPEEARLIGVGVDFGYTNDPTAIIEVYKYNDKRILNERCYRTGLLNNEIARMLNDNETVYADSAEPKSIEEIRRHGINIKGATKGRDSINFGISIMQGENYLVTKHSTNLIKELRYYCWDKDRNGLKINKPIDNFNHAIDAIRYHEMMDIGINERVFTF
jgi:phage terminase large subunit